MLLAPVIASAGVYARVSVIGIALSSFMFDLAAATVQSEPAGVPAGSQGGGMAATADGGVPTGPGEEPATPASAQGVDNAGNAGSAGPSTERAPLTPEQVREAIAEAQKRRLELLQPDSAIADPAIRKDFLERWGVEVIGVTGAARGYMIDFRFRVVDANKALPLFDGRTPAYLIPDGSGIKLPVPAGQKVGAFRTTNRGNNIQSGKNYHIVFANPDAFVKPGQKVSVVIGDFRAEHLTLK